jgi:hypothetical protein
MGQRLIISNNSDKPGRPLLLDGEVIDAASTAAWVRIKGAHREVLPAVFHKRRCSIRKLNKSPWAAPPQGGTTLN